MSDVKDPAIKLFGKTIQFPDTTPPLVLDSVDPPSQTSDGDPPLPPSSPYSSVEEHKEQKSDKNLIADGDGKDQDGPEPMDSEEPTNPSAISTVNNSANSPDGKAAPDEGQLKVALDDDQSTEEGQNETCDSQDKTLKKPDKILPCPRCNSMDTKFCYYNNYNVNQPRHFCKNCQRYWTAGGTMRNVPVGAGRRKNKYSASHYRQIAVSEALQSISVEIPNEIHHPGLKTNGTVLTFGSDSPLCESMTSALNISGKTPLNVSQNGFKKPGELRPLASYKAKDIVDDPQSGSSVTASNSKDEIVTPSLQNSATQTCHSFPPQVPCFPGAPWPYPWNVSQWNAPVPLPGFCAVPMPFYPAAPYWGCNVPVPGPWNVQWINPTSLSGNHFAPSSSPNSPTLGKHSRDENMPNLTNSLDEVSIKEHIPEKNLWVPKTLRIDDPGEAAKSSIWATLGIKNEGADSDSGRSMFKSFQSKDNERCHLSKSSSVLHANPAAMSRSQSFRETT